MRRPLHAVSEVDGVNEMRPLRAGLEIKPGETVVLKPGAYHVMFMDLKRPLQKGQHVTGSLTFEHAGQINIEYEVEAVGVKAREEAGH